MKIAVVGTGISGLASAHYPCLDCASRDRRW